MSTTDRGDAVEVLDRGIGIDATLCIWTSKSIAALTLRPKAAARPTPTASDNRPTVWIVCLLAVSVFVAIWLASLPSCFTAAEAVPIPAAKPATLADRTTWMVRSTVLATV